MPVSDDGGPGGPTATVHPIRPERSAPAALSPAQLERARRGDPEALRIFFESHKKRVAAQIQRMTGDPTAVDDLLQEVFITAFSRLDELRSDSKLRTWLYRIATNKVRNWWDSNRRRRRRERRASAVPDEAPFTPHDDLERREHQARLYQAIGELNPKLREAFVARVIEGLSLQETSDVLDVPISTVSYRARRAEELLCEALGLGDAGAQP